MENILHKNYHEIKQKKSNFKKTLLEVIKNIYIFLITPILSFVLKFSLTKKNRIQFLYFHFAFEDQIEKLDNLMKMLNKNYSFISYSNAIDLILSKSQIDKNYICISTDDGLKNNLEFARIIEKYHAKACFFVCPDILDNVNNISYVKSFCKNQLHIPLVEFMDWNDIVKLKSKGHEIGGHTLSHKNLSKISGPNLVNEIKSCYEILNRKIGNVKHFAWPYGTFHHFSDEAKEIVFLSGFYSCASAIRGAYFKNFDGVYSDLCIRRDHVNLDWSLRKINFFLLMNFFRKNKSNFYNIK